MRASVPSVDVPPVGVLAGWARATWASLAAMTEPATGLVADHIGADLRPGSRAAYTSPSNLGGLLWSAVTACRLGILDASQTRARLSALLTSLEHMDRHRPSGMLYGWYDPATGHRLDRWPGSGKYLRAFVSSVDNAWLAVGLRVVAAAEPVRSDAVLSARVQALIGRMRWEVFFDPSARPRGGLMHAGFYVRKPRGFPHVVEGNHLGTGASLWYTENHYDTLVSETRMATYLAIALGAAPPSAYFCPWRTVPVEAGGKGGLLGVSRRYQGVDVHEGAVDIDGRFVVPSWGGSMFEALMPDLFVPETTWGPNSWGRNHPSYVATQIEFGRRPGCRGLWGWSPCCDPSGRYLVYGVPSLAMNPRRRGSSVVTPHASFLALPHAPAAAVENLRRLEAIPGLYGPGGFTDSYSVRSGRASDRYLAIDQAMSLAALGNALADNALRRWFCTPDLEAALRPVMAQEEFYRGG